MIDLNKKYKTKLGDEVVLSCINNDPHYPVFGKVFYQDAEKWGSCWWTLHGTFFINQKSDLDLVEINETNENEKL